MKTAADLSPVISATNRQIEYWVDQLDLHTTYHQPTQGKRRLFSRENAIELGFIAAVVNGGGTPARAALFAKSFLRTIGRVNREWFVFAAGSNDVESGIASDAPDLAKVQSELGALTLSVVRMGELKRRIDKLFDEA